MNPNNTETDYDYTHYWDLGEEIVKNDRTSDSITLSQFTYTFDANRNKISELDQVMDPGEGASNTQLYTWAYDADGRLTDETFDNLSDGSGGTNIVSTDDYHDHYDYDLNGNRVDEKIDTSADGGTGSSAVYDQVTSSRYDARNELTSETQTTVATGATIYSTGYLYDANGSILSSTRTGSDPGVTTYTYDARNRILTVSSGGSTTTYTYNDDGILVQQAVAGGDTTTYLIDANNPTGYSQVLEVSKNGGLPTTTYTLGKTIIAQNAGGTISYIMPDGHGSTRQLTAFTSDSTNGHVTARYDYDAFGNPITLTANAHAANTAATYVMYVNMLLDPITGSYRTQTREYVAADGRYFTQDTYMPPAGDTGNSNLYVYVGGNPLDMTDPSGQLGLEDVAVFSLSLALDMRDALVTSPVYLYTLQTVSWIIANEATILATAAIGTLLIGPTADWVSNYITKLRSNPQQYTGNDGGRPLMEKLAGMEGPDEYKGVDIPITNGSKTDVISLGSYSGNSPSRLIKTVAEKVDNLSTNRGFGRTGGGEGILSQNVGQKVVIVGIRQSYANLLENETVIQGLDDIRAGAQQVKVFVVPIENWLEGE